MPETGLSGLEGGVERKLLPTPIQPHQRKRSNHGIPSAASRNQNPPAPGIRAEAQEIAEEDV